MCLDFHGMDDHRPPIFHSKTMRSFPKSWGYPLIIHVISHFSIETYGFKDPPFEETPIYWNLFRSLPLASSILMGFSIVNHLFLGYPPSMETPNREVISSSML